jgi:DNA replication and repair protein RecF
MHLKKLNIYNFRNIEQAELEPHRFFNILYGNNAQGKTNFIESIYLLGSLKSFRTTRNEDLIRSGSLEASINGISEKNRVADTMRLDIKYNGKTARLNGKIVNKPDHYLNCLRPVVFSPEEVSLIKGGPAGRRRLIDRAVFQSMPDFLNIVQNYGRQLKQRNKLLKEKKTENEIIPWTDILIKTGAQIRLARIKYIEAIHSEFFQCYKHICGGTEQAEIIYKYDGSTLEKIENEFAEELVKQKDQEIKYGMTLSGPHRDDIDFLLEDKSLKNFGSQGQQRSFILAFKTAQIINIEKIFGEPPLLLLDDLLGELDKKRQEYFFDFLLKMQGQVFITTTEIEPLLKSGISEVSYFNVKNGVLCSSQN